MMRGREEQVGIAQFQDIVVALADLWADFNSS